MAVCLLLWSIFGLIGAENSRNFERIDAKQGLSSGFVVNLLKDSRGILWLATLNGLARYDGYHWKIYREGLNDPNTPQSLIILSLFEENRDILWIGTRGGLVRFDRSKESFKHYHVKLPGKTLDTFSQISQIHQDNQNPDILWLRVFVKLVSFNQRSGQKKIYGIGSDKSQLKSIKIVSHIYQDLSGLLWLVGDGKLLRYDPVSDKILPFRKKEIEDAVISVTPSLIDPNIIWVGYEGYVEKLNTGSFESEIIAPPAGDSGIYFSHVAESLSGESKLLLVAWQKGLFEFDRKNGQLTHFFHDPDNPFSLSNDTIFNMVQEKSGDLWLATYDGLNRLVRSQPLIHVYKQAKHGKKGLSHGMIYDIQESIYRPGQFWVGTANGLNLLNPESGHAKVYQMGEGGFLGANHVSAVCESPHVRDTVWLATLGGGLFKLDLKTDKHIQYTRSEKSTSLGSEYLVSIFESRNAPGILWIGTMDSGLNRFDCRSGESTHYRHDPKNPHSIASGPVSGIIESPASPGVLWLGLAGGGLNRLETKTGRCRRISLPIVKHDLSADTPALDLGPNSEAAEIDPIVNCLFVSESAPGYLWVGTNRGLIRVDIQKERIVRHPGDIPLAGETINQIAEDRRGDLWLTTFDGLFKYNPSSGSILKRDVLYGLCSNELGVLCYTSRDELFVGSLSGLNRFKPSEIVKNHLVPPIMMTGFEIMHHPVQVGKSWRGSVPVLSNEISRTRKIVLSYRDRVFSFRYAALSFYLPQKNQYAYMMEGFDRDWIHVGNRRIATFTGLAPGNYVFRVKGSNNDGVWNDTGVSIQVVITPPWWKTSWAYISYAIFLIAFLFYLNLFQRRRIQKRERDQAKLKEADLRARAAEAQSRAVEAENQRKTNELEKARRMQLSMLPSETPEYPDLKIAVHMNAATEVGGDYYDFIDSSGNERIFVLGDATGHGLNAGTMVSIIKGMLMSSSQYEILPELFNSLNRTIKQMTLGNLFMGLNLIRLTEEGWQLISAGMPPIYIYRKTENRVETINMKTPPLGAFKGYRYQVSDLTLEKGDLLLLLSDGLPELFNDHEEMFGYDRVTDLFHEAAEAGKTPDEIVTFLVSAGENWRQDKFQDDDISFMVIQLETVG